MENGLLVERLNNLRKFYESGETRSYNFRKQQLKRLKAAVEKYEEDLYQALYADLRKNKEEAYLTEIGFVIAEISYTLKHLKKWMKAEKVPTNLLNFPSQSFIYKEPLGVVLVIGPWNYPFQLLFTPLIGAIAGGNCVVIKPAEYAGNTAQVIQKIIKEIYPDDYVISVEGEGARVVPEMMNNFRFDHVFFTGSSFVGKLVYGLAAEQLVPVTLELGGKSPCVVESDADITVAAKRIALAKFSNAGQMCVAPDYLLVHESVKDALVNELKKQIESFYSVDPENNYHYGRIINETSFNRILKYIQCGKLIYGGYYNASTMHISPTLIENVSMDDPVMKEEIFGPLLPIISFSTTEQARDIISKNPDPLGFYIFTESKARQKDWIESVHFGGGCVNNVSWQATNLSLPFGGRGNSGIGSYHGKFSFDVFTHRKAVMKTPTRFDIRMKYPPYKGKLSFIKKILN